MAFVKKTWKDRDSEYPNRRIIDEGNVQKAVTVSRFEGVIYEEGDAFNAANMNDLEDRISAIESAQYEASGNIASFDCLSSSNLISCVCNINPTQSGSGTPSPDNVRPISGYSELNVFVKDGTDVTKSTTNIDLGRTVYGGTLDVTSGTLTVEWVKIVGLAGRYNSFANGTYSTFYRISLPELSTSGAISLKRGAISNCKVEETAYFGSNRTAQIESQKDIFAITTGGELLAIYDKDNTLTRTQFEEKYSDFEACYPLATPQIYQLTPHQIQTILGENNIYHDGNGEISVTYVDAIKNGRLPLPPTTDGNYVLKLTVSGGIPAYTWQSAT